MYLCCLEKNFKHAKRLKEERDALTQEGIKSQDKLERLLKELTEDKKSLEKAQQESADLEAEIGEKDCLAGKIFTFSLPWRLNEILILPPTGANEERGRKNGRRRERS